MSKAVRVRTSWWFYVLALALFVGGVGYFFYDLWHGLPHIADSLVQIVVPGEAQLNLRHGQDYTVFLEARSVVSGKIYSTDDSMSGLECKVSASSRDEVIPLLRPGVSTTYNVGRRSGRSVLQFRVPQDGTYKFACGYGEATRGPEIVLAVGSGVGQGILRIVLTGLLVLFGGIGSSFVIGLATFLLRHQAKSRAASPSQFPGATNS